MTTTVNRAAAPAWRGWDVIELDGGGHRLWYVSLILRGCLTSPAGTPIRLVTRPSVPSLPAWHEHIEPLVAASPVEVITTVASHEEILTGLVPRGRAVVIPEGDGWLLPLLRTALLRRRRVQGSLLVMRPGRARGLTPLVRHGAKLLSLAAVRLAHPSLQAFGLAAAPDRVTQLPDPVRFSPRVVDRATWLSLLGCDARLRWLLVIGELSDRKCVPEIARAVSDLPSGDGWGLVAVGKPDEHCRGLLQDLASHQPDRFVFSDRYLTDCEFDTWVSIADAVAVVHRNEGSSGVLLKSWVAGTPVVVGGAKSVVDAVHRLGANAVVIQGITAPEIRSALRALTHSRARNAAIPDGTWREREQTFVARLLGRPVGNQRPRHDERNRCAPS
jgi:hypothetical protein